MNKETIEKRLEEIGSIGIRIKISDDATNIDVADKVDFVITMFFEMTNNIKIGIKEESKEIFILARKKLDKSEIDLDKIKEENVTRTIISNKLKENDRRAERYSFMMTETVMDTWLKFKATEFYAEADLEEIGRYKLMMNYGGEKEIQKYWNEKFHVGWNPQGGFWKRDWLRDEQKQTTTASGKVKR